MVKTYNAWRSRAVWGAALVALGHVLANPSVETVIEAAGVILTAVGVRGAVAKNGDGR